MFGDEIGQSISSVKTAWRSACERSGISGLRFHDLRREFACRLLESRAELHDVRDFLGHANITTTSRYLRSTTLRLERALTLQERHEEQKTTTDGASRGKKDSGTIATSLPHGASGHPTGNEDIDRQIADLIEDVVVSRIFASWNLIRGWLAQVEGLRCVA